MQANDGCISPAQFPPGLLGEIAHFILEAAPRPVPEIALAGAIGLLAGISGRSYNVSGTGLNQYILLVAKTGRGKEAIASGISKLMKQVIATAPCAKDFQGPVEIASPQALIKWLTRSPCIYSIVGEFGLKLKEMAASNAPTHSAGLKRALLDLYQKSGAGSVLGAMAYSNREDNTSVVNSPAFTIIGESTPSTLFENISESIIADGLLPRFLVIEYHGPRSEPSFTHDTAIPSATLVGKLSELSSHCASLSTADSIQRVEISTPARELLDTFNRYCDEKINADEGGVIGCELWNRAHLKATKLAALIAVGVNYINPTISQESAQLATDFVHAQTAALCARFSRGDIGAPGNETRQHREVARVMREYVSNDFSQASKYGVMREMHQMHVIPASYILRRLSDTAAFRGQGSSARAINEVLNRMLDADEIRQLPKHQMVSSFGTNARAFMVSNPEYILNHI